jgi:hypothetical protein
MRNIFLVVITIACAGLMRGRSYAAPRVAFQQATAASSPNTTAAGSAPAADGIKTDRPHPLPHNEHSKLGNDRNLHEPGSIKRVFAASGGSFQSKPSRTVPAGRPKVVARSVMIARHRGSNPAFVGGPTSINAKGTGIIDGTQMNHKR